MEFATVSMLEGIAVVTCRRGRVNALNERAVDELAACFRELALDPEVRGAVLTGHGKFFSFGFDIPEFLGYSQEAFVRYLTKFTDLYRFLFSYPKPLVAALNGHAIAGGCMLALACDQRLFASGNAKISLNEITFGSSVFAGSVEMLQWAVGERNAQEILYSGAMYSADEALGLGLVDRVTTAEALAEEARSAACHLAEKDAAAFESIKRLLRGPVAQAMAAREGDSIREFVDLWYSPGTWSKLQAIKIRD